MKNLIFESWHSWWVCFASGWQKLAWGLCRIVTCIILGVISLIVAAWRAMVRWVGRYPNIALGAFIVVVALVWLLMFARNRATKVGLEAQRDSVAWQYQQFKEGHGYE